MLIIPHVRESDSGEYCCLATNGVGEPAKSCGALQLKMSMCAWLLWRCHGWSRSRGRCVIQNFWVSPSEPQIKRHPTNLTLLVEAKAVLPCVTLGNPKPDVTWLKDDELIKVCAVISALLENRVPFSALRCCPQVSDRVTVLDYGALKIHNIRKEDAGQYRCVARNSFGFSISKPVSIEVQGTSSNICQ